MQMDSRIIAAVAAALELYLEAERQLVTTAGAPGHPAAAPYPGVSPWAAAGRQSMMDMRRLLQMRLVR